MKNIFVFFLISFSLTAFAQRRVVEKLDREAPNLKLSFLGRTNRSGVKAGIELMLTHKQVTINRKSGSSFIKEKEGFVTANVGVFQHSEFGRCLMLTTELIQRKSYSSGLFIEAAAGIGLQKIAQPYTDTYLKNADGSLTKISTQKNFMLIPLGVGLGYDFEKKLDKPIKMYAKLGLNYSSYGKWPYPNPMADIGVIASLSTFKKKK